MKKSNPQLFVSLVSYNPSSPWWVLLGILQRCNAALSSESIPAVVAFLVNLKIFFDLKKKKG